jgi:hypothetical protein
MRLKIGFFQIVRDWIPGPGISHSFPLFLLLSACSQDPQATCVMLMQMHVEKDGEGVRCYYSLFMPGSPDVEAHSLWMLLHACIAGEKRATSRIPRRQKSIKDLLFTCGLRSGI